MATFDKTDKLTLYHFGTCPYCVRVRNVIQELGVDVKDRDIFEDKDAYDELVAARGTRTVPVLRIHSEDGADHWMPESADIVDWLRQQFG